MHAAAGSRLSFRPMSVEDAQLVARWRYPQRWSVYDLPSATVILDDIGDYWAVLDTGRGALVGFFCVGAAARVPGLDEDPGLIDIGMGMDPGLVGQGNGVTFGQAVLDFVAREFPGRLPRAAVQSWNERSLRLTRRLGFTEMSALTAVQDGQPVHYRVVAKQSV